MTGRAVASRPRGQPLLVLAIVLGGWLALRILLWQSPFTATGLVPMLAHAPFAPATALARTEPAAVSLARAKRSAAIPGPRDAPLAEPLPAPWPGASPPSAIAQAPTVDTPSAGSIVGHQLLLVAALSQMKLPSALAAYFLAPTVREQPNPLGQPLLGHRTPVDKAAASRWSGDAWLLWRRDSVGSPAAGQPSYGRSQAGAVLRFRLAPASGHRPVAYARVTRALAGPSETEFAAGLAARPLARVPLSVAAELRWVDRPTGREARPAAFAVTELPPIALALGFRGEAYAQAGYVGGRFATAFVDGEARLDKRIAQIGGEAEVRAGGGLWGGAQRDAARLDIGPTAGVDFRLGDARSRLNVDYRVRVAGGAAPKSGPALTISAGF